MFLTVYFFQTSEILAALAAVLEGYNNEEKAAQLKKVRSGTSTHRRTLLSKRRCAHAMRPFSVYDVTEQRHLRVPSQECGREGGVVDDRPEKDRHGEEGRGKVARSQAGRDDHLVGRDVRRDRGRQDDGPEGVHDGRAQDEREHDARDETRRRPQGMCTRACSSLRRDKRTLLFAIQSTKGKAKL